MSRRTQGRDPALVGSVRCRSGTSRFLGSDRLVPADAPADTAADTVSTVASCDLAVRSGAPVAGRTTPTGAPAVATPVALAKPGSGGPTVPSAHRFGGLPAERHAVSTGCRPRAVLGSATAAGAAIEIGDPVELGAPARVDAPVADAPVADAPAASVALGSCTEPVDPARGAEPTDLPNGLEPHQLWASFREAPTRALRDLLVVHHLPLVRAVAHRLAAGLPPYVDVADLIQSGIFGLIDAVQRYVPERSPRFEGYAARRIRGAILDELRAQDWVPRSVRGRVRELDRAQEVLEARLRRGATERELAAELGMSLRELTDLTRHVQLASIEALHDAAGGISELFPDLDAPDPLARIQEQETMRELAAAVEELGERDRMVIRLYYHENQTLAEIGLMLGVTESRVCQLHTRLVRRLRGRLEKVTAS